MALRTDLALEAHEIAGGAGALEGVTSEESEVGSIKVTKVKVLDERGVQKIGKPVGTYVTVEAPGLDDNQEESFNSALEAIAKELEEMLEPYGNGMVLVAGLGNKEMTPDAIGPGCVENLLVTRHIAGELTKIQGLEGLRAVSAIAPGVLGQTGVEAGEILKALVSKIQPVAVIVVDALASRRVSRLGNTVQISDTGIVPGSGVGNSRFAINKETLDVPVISMGVPTVVDAATFAIDVLDNAGIRTDDGQQEKIRSSIEPGGITMYVTPRFIDLVVQHASRLTGYAINRALHPTVSVEDMARLVS